jgi:gamma-glutamylcyclotransferase (GGCT)/AIG2-like uncharacterized protein YtfP
MDLFVYGTLMDEDVLGRVIGRAVPASRIGAAFVDGYRRVYVEGTYFPILVPVPGGSVEGRLITGLGAQAVARLSRFEGRQFRLERMPVRLARGRTAEVECFMPAQGIKATVEEWRPDIWRRRHKAAFLKQLRWW